MCLARTSARMKSRELIVYPLNSDELIYCRLQAQTHFAYLKNREDFATRPLK